MFAPSKPLPALFLLALLFLCLAPATGAAPITLFDNRTAFNAASRDRTSLGFENLAPDSTLRSYNTAAGLISNGVGFIGVLEGSRSNGTPLTAYTLHVAGRGFYTSGTSVLVAPHSYDPNVGAPGTGSLWVVLPENTTAVGMDFSNIFAASANHLAGMNVSVTTSDGVTQSFSLADVGNTMRFAGFSVLAPGVTIEMLTINSNFNSQTGQYNTPLLGNFTFGRAVTPVPEPATMLLLGTGLIGLGAAARRRRRADCMKT